MAAIFRFLPFTVELENIVFLLSEFAFRNFRSGTTTSCISVLCGTITILRRVEKTQNLSLENHFILFFKHFIFSWHRQFLLVHSHTRTATQFLAVSSCAGTSCNFKNSSMELTVIWGNFSCSNLACSDLACSDLAHSDLGHFFVKNSYFNQKNCPVSIFKFSMKNDFSTQTLAPSKSHIKIFKNLKSNATSQPPIQYTTFLQYTSFTKYLCFLRYRDISTFTPHFFHTSKFDLFDLRTPKIQIW